MKDCVRVFVFAKRGLVWAGNVFFCVYGVLRSQ